MKIDNASTEEELDALRKEYAQAKGNLAAR
jgi:hypothetical protein